MHDNEYLEDNTLVGLGDQNGPAWWKRTGLDSKGEPNHYPGPVPVEDIRRRLLYWQPVIAEVHVKADILSADGVTSLDIHDDSRLAVVHPETGRILGMHKSGYKVHDYDEWCIRNVETVVDSTANDGSLVVAGAGMLKWGALFWVQFQLNQTREVAGVKYRPFITAFTSLDGSLASTYTRGSQVVVCDNTLSSALGQAKTSGHIARRKHTKHSLANIDEVRQKLDIIFEVDEAFKHQLEVLTNTTVSESEWSAFVQAHMPIKDDAKGSALGRAEARRERLTSLWNADERVTPWKGTAFGVIQAVNTFTHHMSRVVTSNGLNRGHANTLRMVEGGHDALDKATLDTLNSVFAAKRRKQITFA
jgi:phage/plasmid-like protein (TIGR03299 family)